MTRPEKEKPLEQPTTFVYRCKLCGEEMYSRQDYEWTEAAIALHAFTISEDTRQIAASLCKAEYKPRMELYELHKCEAGGLGLAELVGINSI